MSALVNLAALLMGKVPVNLNYTLSEEPLASCVRQCKLQTVLTSQAFLNRVKVKIPCRTLLLEQVAAQPRFGEKLLALGGVHQDKIGKWKRKAEEAKAQGVPP